MAHSAQRPADAGFPERVGRYELLLPIGVGGMATVYLARAMVVTGVWRDFALKLMHPQIRADPELSSQLMQEAKLAARIRHPHVVQVVEVADDPMGMFLVLEYIEGDALSGLINAARARGELLPRRIAGRILSDALIGLHAAHELTDDDGVPLKLVHRDFSPHNILVGTDGLSRLADFGIAKAEGDQATTTGVLKGKVGYMAPEYVLGRDLDRRSDIWSAGVVLWELLSGQRLFKVKNDVAALVRLISQPPPRIEDFVPDVPGPVAELVRGVLTPDPGARCPDAATFCTRLTEAWNAYGGLAERTEVGEYVTRLAAPTLRKRRQEISSISARRAAAPSERVGFRAPHPAANAELEPASDEQTGSPQVIPRRGRRRRVAAGAGGLVVIVAAGALAVWTLDEKPSSSEQPVVASTGTAATIVARSVVVRADEPIARLRVGRRTVALSGPTREIEVELLPTETGEIAIEASSVDGRTTKRTLQPSEGSLTLEFPAPDAARAEARDASVASIDAPVPKPRRAPKRKTQARPEVRPEPTSTPGLAPTPFRK